MKIVNVMNFVRQSDYRLENSEELLYNVTARELELVNQYEIDNTFLLQYDAVIDERYANLFKSKATERTELGLWFEVVRPLTDAVGLPWRGRENAKWDWHIVPGFLMAYTQEERKKLIDEAMGRFKEVYGYYPRTVASWLLDSYSVAYMAENYEISAFAICRDQTSTDAYTLVGGYFNQAYYPSKYNMFTPAQSEECRVKTPVFRLLGPDPIHNYDNAKYITKQEYLPYKGCYTLEAVWRTGWDAKLVRWFFDTYYKNEDLGFSYAQIGQENSFAKKDVVLAIKQQIEILKDYPEVQFMKMGDAGEVFKAKYKETPATSVCALQDWGSDGEVQSIYYNCKNYTANLFRHKNRIFIRGLYLFDEKIVDDYYTTPCDTWDATYENMPVVDTLLWEGNEGLVLDKHAEAFQVKKQKEGVLEVAWGKKAVVFYEDRIVIRNTVPTLDIKGRKAKINQNADRLDYVYKGNHYSLCVCNGIIAEQGEQYSFTPDSDELVFYFKRGEETC